MAQARHAIYALYGVDVRLVTSECLRSLAATDIPKLRRSVTCTRHEDVLTRTERQAEVDFSE